MYIIFFIGLIFLMFLIVFFLRRKTLLLLPNIYIIMNIFYLLGIIYLTDPNNPFQIHLVLVHVAGITSFVLGICLVKIIRGTYCKPSKNKSYRTNSEDYFIANSFLLERVLAWTLLVFSLFIGFLYYKLVGYNLFYLGIKNLLSEGTMMIEDAATLRLSSYAGDRYLAPGYFNQFKNIIIVIVWQYLFVYYCLNRRNKTILWLLLPAIFLLLVGTGQRAAFAYAIVSFLIFYTSIFNKKSFKAISLSLVVFFIVFTSSSAIIGRGVEGEVNIQRTFVQGFNQLTKRVFLDNPGSAQYGFEFINEKKIPPQFFKETFLMIRNILPFNKTRVTTIDSQIFASKYGSPRGTSPLSTYGQIWYDSRIFGVFFFSAFLGIFYELLSLIFERNKNLFVISCWSYCKTILGFWTSGGPMTLLIKGIVTISILLLIHFSVDNLRKILVRKPRLIQTTPFFDKKTTRRGKGYYVQNTKDNCKHSLT